MSRELLRVVPVARRIEGTGIWITALEVWSDRLVVHWAEEHPKAPADIPERRMTMEDDSGTRYAPRGGGRGGSRAWMDGRDEFEALRAGARALTITVLDGIIALGSTTVPLEPD